MQALWIITSMLWLAPMKMSTHRHTYVKRMMPLYKVHWVHARTLTNTHTHLYCTENHSGWARETWMCLWSWQMVHGNLSPPYPNLITWHVHEGPQCQKSWLWCVINHQSGVGSEDMSCWAWTSPGLQAAEVCLPQDSVDVVVRDTAAITMETMLQRAGRVFRLRAKRVLWDAVGLAMWAWARAGHYCSLRNADPITAIIAGRLQTHNQRVAFKSYLSN